MKNNSAYQQSRSGLKQLQRKVLNSEGRGSGGHVEISLHSFTMRARTLSGPNADGPPRRRQSHHGPPPRRGSQTGQEQKRPVVKGMCNARSVPGCSPNHHSTVGGVAVRSGLLVYTQPDELTTRPRPCVPAIRALRNVRPSMRTRTTSNRPRFMGSYLCHRSRITSISLDTPKDLGAMDCLATLPY